MTSTSKNDEMITVVDCYYSYTEAKQRNYRKYNIKDVVDAWKNHAVISNVSRYEILKELIRRIAFDIEKIPTDQPELIYQIIKDLQRFLVDKGVCKEPPKYVLTFNSGSKNHEGLSYHLIFYEYSMHYNVQRALVLAFVNSDYGNKYIEYIDCTLYSSVRLFKLPYYIGIIKANGEMQLDTNKDNYHRIMTKDVPESAFVIQYTKDAKYVTHDFEVKPEWYQKERKISPKWQNQIGKAIEHVVTAVLKKVDDKKNAKENSQANVVTTYQKKLETLKENIASFSVVRQKMIKAIEKDDIKITTINMYKNLIDQLFSKLDKSKLVTETPKSQEVKQS